MVDPLTLELDYFSPREEARKVKHMHLQQVQHYGQLVGVVSSVLEHPNPP